MVVYIWNFPGSSDGKESTCNAYDVDSWQLVKHVGLVILLWSSLENTICHNWPLSMHPPNLHPPRKAFHLSELFLPNNLNQVKAKESQPDSLIRHWTGFIACFLIVWISCVNLLVWLHFPYLWLNFLHLVICSMWFWEVGAGEGQHKWEYHRYYGQV